MVVKQNDETIFSMGLNCSVGAKNEIFKFFAYVYNVKLCLCL